MLGVIDGGEFLRFAALTQDSYSRSDTRFAARGRSGVNWAWDGSSFSRSGWGTSMRVILTRPNTIFGFDGPAGNRPIRLYGQGLGIREKRMDMDSRRRCIGIRVPVLMAFVFALASAGVSRAQ